MASLKTYALSNSAIIRIAADKDLINLSPSYQRRGGIWNLERKQLLIDSIINEYDIPKLYFHHILPWYPKEKFDSEYKYAVIDGRQRLSAILDFLDDKFPLAEDFKYFEDLSVSVAGMHYSQMSKENPRLKVIFDSFTLPITLIETDDLDLVEDMFSRLNEASPLSGAEKRNALGGPMAAAIARVAEHPLIAIKSRISNSRYQHREVAARLLFVEYSLRSKNRIIDTKRPYLDEMVTEFRKDGGLLELCEEVATSVIEVLNFINPIFRASDPLLASQSFMVPLFLVFRGYQESLDISREDFENFKESLRKNRVVAELSISDASIDLLGYDRMSQQGTNDASSIVFRVDTLRSYLTGGMDAEIATVEAAFERINVVATEMESQIEGDVPLN
ncbi:DUF262 domain-containing protein [Pseudoxanthomonas sp. LARHCG66]